MKSSRKRTSASDKGAHLQNILVMALFICILTLSVRLINNMADSAPFENAILEYVVDGDTIDVTMNGEEIRIRLIGIDTPESVSRTEENTPEGQAASDYLKNYIHTGQKLYVEYDEEQIDRYGRTLAYIWLSPDADTGSFDDFCKYNLSAIIYQNTYCELMTIAPNDKYYDWFKELNPWQKK